MWMCQLCRTDRELAAQATRIAALTTEKDDLYC